MSLAGSATDVQEKRKPKTLSRDSSLRTRSALRRVRCAVARNRPAIQSVAIFVASLLACFLALPVYIGFLEGPASIAIARATGFVLRVFGTKVQVAGAVVSSSAFSMEVIAACTGVYATIIYLAAVLAFPCRLSRKVLGVAFGVPTILAVNMVRMVSLFYIGMALPQHFEVAHLFFWQALMIIAAVLTWLFWAQRMAHARTS
jgi:exosortase H (IPTLxxWG-CTERM-specific)